MEVIDDFLVKNNKYEFSRYIMPGVFYTFGYMLLLDLEHIYKVIGVHFRNLEKFWSVQKPENFDTEKELLDQIFQKHFAEIGLEISSKEELAKFLNYMNELTRMACFMFMTYKEKIHFPEDIAFDNYLQFKNTLYDFEKGNTQETERINFG